ncbi:uncharacterized protein LOC141664683 [Apium graveolens]|uniref:uncharacterized protein LOC141664683 n=1 Tax=Apium graveolens TaxID=4045 RepID=UPI003D7BBD7D
MGESSVAQRTTVTEVLYSSNKLTEKKLEGVNNYPQWKKIVKLALVSRDQEDYLTTKKEKADSVWEVADAQILYQLLNSMEGHIVDLDTHVDTVKELWDYLEVLYSGQNNMVRIFEVSQEFFRISRDGCPLTQFFAYFKNLYEEYNSLLPISVEVQKMQIQREQAVMSFLGSLGPEFKSVRSQLLSSSELPSLTDTFTVRDLGI